MDFYRIYNFSEDRCIFYGNNSDTLIIWFGGLGEPFLSEKLSKFTNMDCLIFRDKDSNWYMNGVSNQYNSREKMIQNLRNFKNSQNYKKILFCGQSSGGYAALFFFHYVGGDLSIVFSPQTANQFSGDGHMSPPFKLKDISKLFRRNDKNIIINISRSEKNHEKKYRWDDWWQIRYLRNYPNVTIITHPYDSHATTLFLREKNIFYKFMKNIIDIYL